MALLDDLEAQLREGLDRGVDRDIVVVYGDQLQALGDPRGELIVVDLELEQSGPSPTLLRRRGELIDGWLGAHRPNGAIRFGFIELDATSADPVSQVRVALDGPAARFIRSVTVVGPPAQLRATLAALAEAPRPFLSRVTIRQWDDTATPSLDDSSAFSRATPHLRCLELDARLLFADLEHPTLHRLRVSGFDAIATLASGTLALPELVELDLALHCHLASARSAPPDRVFERLGAQLPKLATLDLSRNERGYLDPHTLGGDLDVFGLVPKLACRGRLSSLALPAPVSQAAISSVRAALASMPELRELVLHRARVADRESLAIVLERPGLAIRFVP